jgi:protein-tyrosine phosphatase
MSYYSWGGEIVEIKNKLEIKNEIDKKPTYPVYSKKECHCGTIEVFKDPKTNIPICGGGEYRGVQITPEDLLIDVGIKLDSLVEIKNVEGTEKLNEYGNYKIIKINWKDMDDVNLPKEFWIELVKVIRKTKRRTIISCVGGHGRTGTTLSILAFLMKGEKEPIKFVRENYCQEAVETNSQIEYVEDICNLKLKDEPSKFYYSSYNLGYGTKDEEKGGKDQKTETDKLKEDSVLEDVKTTLDLDKLYPQGLIEDEDYWY